MNPTTPFSEGDPTSPITFLGEAPSSEEMREGRPFVGPAGKLLDLCLHSSRISRAESYITNVFDEPVRKSDDGKIFDSSKTLLWESSKGFTPTGIEATKGCRARLAATTSNVIVALGAPALHLALDVRSISNWRGSILARPDGRKVIPTFHPAYCLHGAYEDRHIIISDLTKAKRHAAFPDLRRPVRNITIDPTYDACIALLKRCLSAPAINTDIEILRGQVDCFSIATSPSEAITIPIIDAGFEHRWSAREEAEIWTLYAQILQSPHVTKINTNIGFDLGALLQLNNIVPCGPLHDPQIAQSLIYPFIKKSLAMMCSLHTDEPFYKDQGELKDSQNVADFQRRWNYCALDSAVSFECNNALQPMIDESNLRRTYNETVRRTPIAVYMTVHGMRVDRAALEVTKAKTATRLAEIATKIQEVMGRPIITKAPKTAADKRAAAGAININSPAQMMAFFYGEKKYKPYVNQIGKPTLDDRALARLIRREESVEARLLQEFRSLSKLASTYYGAEYDEENSRIHASWNLRGTWTGRLSSGKAILGGKGGEGSGFNMQNQPEEMRGFLVADDVPAEVC